MECACAESSCDDNKFNADDADAAMLVPRGGAALLARSLALLTIAAPASPLDAIWRINPRGHDAFVRMGAWAFPLPGAVCMACAATAVGLIARKLWGYRLAVIMLVANFIGGLANVLSGNEPRAIVGVPIVALILWYVMTRPDVRPL